MKIAVFYDLPHGGALVAIQEFAKILQKKHQLDLFTIDGNQTERNIFPNCYLFSKNQPIENFPTLFHRLYSDFYGLYLVRKVDQQIADRINHGGYDLALISHSRFIDSPHLLRYLTIPSIYLCQGPPRYHYEYNLRVDDRWPLLNRLYENLIRHIRKNLDRINCRSATTIVTSSYFAAEAIKMWYDRNAAVAYSGVDPKIFQPQKTKKLNQVVIVGNPEPQKAIDLAIKSISRIKENRPQLIVVSPRFSDNPKLRQLAKKLSVSVDWRCGLSPKDLAKIYSQSLLTLAVSHREHLGLSVLESLSCATPVVAVREGGFRETVSDNITGFLVDRKENNLTIAMNKIIAHPIMAKKMGEMGRKEIQKNWTWSETAKPLKKLITRISHHVSK